MENNNASVLEEKPVLNVNEGEIDLIKSTFEGNDHLLKSIRALMLNLEVSDEDKAVIKKTFSNERLVAIFEKKFYPTLDPLAEIGTASDVWLGVETMIFGQPGSTIEQAIGYKQKALELTRQGLDLLKNPDGVAVNVTYNGMEEDYLGIELLARNQYIRHIENQLMFIKMISGGTGKKEATENKAKNSNR